MIFFQGTFYNLKLQVARFSADTLNFHVFRNNVRRPEKKGGFLKKMGESFLQIALLQV